MRTLIFLFIMGFCVNAFADDYYAIERKDGSVTILTYVTGSNDSMEEVLRHYDSVDQPIIKVDPEKLPKGDRELWSIDPIKKKVVVDPVKKQQKQEEKDARELEKDNVLSKLKINKQEVRLLKEALDS